MYELEPYPKDPCTCKIAYLRYRSIRNMIRRSLNEGILHTWPGIQKWLQYLPAEERQELGELLVPTERK